LSLKLVKNSKDRNAEKFVSIAFFKGGSVIKKTFNRSLEKHVLSIVEATGKETFIQRTSEMAYYRRGFHKIKAFAIVMLSPSKKPRPVDSAAPQDVIARSSY
jgi:hypothetical protein